MSRPYSSHSRGSRSRGESNISVTEASFQNLQLHETAGSHHSPAPSTYTPQDPRYPRASHHRGETASSYLQAGFDTSSFGSFSPSETYIDPQRLTTSFTPSSSESLDFLNPQSLAYNRADMGYSYAQDPYRGTSPYLSSRSPSVPAYTYSGAESTPQRSMSGSSGPTILPSSVPSRLSPSEGEIFRQRRRDSQHSRRANKLRYRRTALPSISEARPSAAPDMSQSIDFVVASTTATPYSLPSTYDPQYNRTVPSNYLPSSSSPYVSGTYAYGTSMGGTNYSHGSSQSSTQSRRTSTAPSNSPNTETPVRVVESRSRPQCWDHGCNGRQFSTFSNLLRHQREKSGTAAKSYCPRCGAEFTRTTARNGHVQEGKCSKQERRKSPADR